MSHQTLKSKGEHFVREYKIVLYKWIRTHLSVLKSMCIHLFLQIGYSLIVETMNNHYTKFKRQNCTNYTSLYLSFLMEEFTNTYPPLTEKRWSDADKEILRTSQGKGWSHQQSGTPNQIPFLTQEIIIQLSLNQVTVFHSCFQAREVIVTVPLPIHLFYKWEGGGGEEGGRDGEVHYTTATAVNSGQPQLTL